MQTNPQQPPAAQRLVRRSTIGEIILNPNDVLKGRGVTFNSHQGNIYFRSLVNELKVDYVHAPKHRKPKFAEYIIKKIQSLRPPGRFLKLVSKNPYRWEEISYKEATMKTRQALREGAKDIFSQNRNSSSPVTSSLVPQIGATSGEVEILKAKL